MVMGKIIIRTVKGNEYIYLEETLRIGKKVRKISKYLGLKEKTTKKEIKKAQDLFATELLNKKVELKIKILKKEITNIEYPFNFEEIKKIEEMNFKYKKIIKNLHPKNSEDLNKRFIANYVFESNALEGNSLTLKNVNEVVFENRISKGQDLREIYDAQNSYAVFLFLQKSRKEITPEFIVKIHTLMMKGIDDRLGFRKIPIMLLGKPNAPLSKPENIEQDMVDLLDWYKQNKNKMHTLELAFKFHAKFEKIHPFCDGNGRVGRFLLNYILMKHGYFPVIIRKTIRNKYLNALEVADKGRWIVLMRFALKYYKETFRKFFEIYYQYI